MRRKMVEHKAELLGLCLDKNPSAILFGDDVRRWIAYYPENYRAKFQADTLSEMYYKIQDEIRFQSIMAEFAD